MSVLSVISKSDSTVQPVYVHGEVSRWLTSQVPLQPGEKHCPYCGGYGGNPANAPAKAGRPPVTCYECEGSGKQ